MQAEWMENARNDSLLITGELHRSNGKINSDVSKEDYLLNAGPSGSSSSQVHHPRKALTFWTGALASQTTITLSEAEDKFSDFSTSHSTLRVPNNNGRTQHLGGWGGGGGGRHPAGSIQIRRI